MESLNKTKASDDEKFMKTKIILIALTAITLLSFTLVSTKKSTANTASGSEASQKGFALQDSNQF